MNDVVSFAKLFDYTNLKNNLFYNELDKFCKDALEYGFYGVCVQPYYVPFVIKILKNTTIRVISVVDFPYGTSLLGTKLQAVEELTKTKLEEIDYVMNIPALINKEYRIIEEEISKSLEICRSNNVKLKVIIETGLLLPEEIAQITKMLCEFGVDFIKTSTGIVSRGVSPEDIKIIKDNLSGTTKIKASGGIRTLEQVLKLIELGVSRIGTSSAIKILKEFEDGLNYD